MILYFPAMTAEFLAGPAAESGLFFDPGLEDAQGANTYRPKNLPLAPATARRLLQDSLQFGKQFKNPGDMIVQSLFQEAEDSEHSWTIRAEFEQRLKVDAGQAVEAEEDTELADMAQAQFLLLLASATQAQSLELKGLSQDVSRAWEKFGEKLGLGDDEGADEAVASLSRTMAATNTFDDSPEPLPWPWLLGAMAAWVPAGTILAATDAAVVHAWRELDGKVVAKPALGLPAGWQVVTGPAWKLAGKRRAPVGEHWLKELTAAFPAQ